MKYEEYTLRRTGDKDLKFEGIEIADQYHEYDSDRYNRVSFYLTKGGSIVTAYEYRSAWANEESRYWASVHKSPETIESWMYQVLEEEDPDSPYLSREWVHSVWEAAWREAATNSALFAKANTEHIE